MGDFTDHLTKQRAMCLCEEPTAHLWATEVSKSFKQGAGPLSADNLCAAHDPTLNSRAFLHIQISCACFPWFVPQEGNALTRKSHGRLGEANLASWEPRLVATGPRCTKKGPLVSLTSFLFTSIAEMTELAGNTVTATFRVEEGARPACSIPMALRPNCRTLKRTKLCGHCWLLRRSGGIQRCLQIQDHGLLRYIE